MVDVYFWVNRSLTPTGVEHKYSVVVLTPSGIVNRSLTPTGVEHVAILVKPVLLRKCEPIFDADRR